MARKGGVTLTHLLFGAHPLTSELQQTWNQGLANHAAYDHVPAESETVGRCAGCGFEGRLQLLKGAQETWRSCGGWAFTAGGQR